MVDKVQTKKRKPSHNTQEVGYIPNKRTEHLEAYFRAYVSDVRECKGRIIVMEGPPGWGKSATVAYLAEKYELGIDFWTGFELPYMYEKIQYTITRNTRGGITLGKRTKPPVSVLVVELLPIPTTHIQQADLLSFMRQIEKFPITKLLFILTNQRASKMLGDPMQPEVKYTLLKFPPLNKTTVKKVLQSRSDKEGSDFSSQAITDLATNCNGDLSSGIASLTLEATTAGRKTNVGNTAKDFNWCIFHALGKIMYNKRLDTGSTPVRSLEMARDTRGAMYFDPNQIISEISGEIYLFYQMLFENYIDFYSEIDDVAEALEYLSLSDLIPDQEESVLLSTRAILDTNLHGAPIFGKFVFRSPEHIYRLRKIQIKTEDILTKARSPDMTSFMSAEEYWVGIGTWEASLNGCVS